MEDQIWLPEKYSMKNSYNKNGSRKIAPQENCPAALILMLILNQTLTLTGGQFSSGQFSGHQ